MTGPLDGIRVLTFTQAWAGTSATELLGFLGADVLQIESRDHPDGWRGGYVGPVPEGIRDPGRRQRRWNVAAAYNSVNLNKRAITLDVADPRGLALVKRLVSFADVVADNFTPRVMAKWGLDYASLTAIKPDIIQASLSAYGATGPWRDLRGIGGTIEPMSGLSSLLGYEDGPPQNSGSMIPDPIAGLWFAAAIVTALRHRDTTGEGQYIDLGMMEANAMITGDAFLEYTANGRVRPRMGNHHPSIAPHNIYATRGDEWLALSADTGAEWEALKRVVGDAALDDERFGSPDLRKRHERALDERLAAWAEGQVAAEAEAALCAAGVPAARLRRVDEVLRHPALVERGFGVRVAYPEAGAHLVAGVPWRMSKTQPAVSRPAPMLGEHSFEVLSGFLGVTREEYEALVADNVSGDGPPQ
jgi:benzylsuccinate CoA-transferase BbsF subunit